MWAIRRKNSISCPGQEEYKVIIPPALETYLTSYSGEHQSFEMVPVCVPANEDNRLQYSLMTKKTASVSQKSVDFQASMHQNFKMFCG